MILKVYEDYCTISTPDSDVVHKEERIRRVTIIAKMVLSSIDVEKKCSQGVGPDKGNKGGLGDVMYYISCKTVSDFMYPLYSTITKFNSASAQHWPVSKTIYR